MPKPNLCERGPARPHHSWFLSFAGLVPALIFGTMASLGVGRSGLGDLAK